MARVSVVLGLLSACVLETSETHTPATKVQYMEMKDDYTPAEIAPSDTPSPFFVHEGAPYCFAGTNNYYLIYKSPAAVVDVLDAAVDMGLPVIRTWAFLDRGSLDGRVPNVRDPGHKDGVYFQYWDPGSGKPAYNDGPDGLERLDFVIHEARKRGLKVMLVLTNSWRDFGGMDQYLVWYGLNRHHLFFTDPRVKQAYKDWVHHLIMRENTRDGIRYRDDPTIFAWELANEPRTLISDAFDDPNGWDATTITRWADEMSAYVKSLDPNHLVAVGDEGFMRGGRNHWAYEAPYGVDHEALTALPNVDFGTYHLYPDHWGTGHRWGMDWIEDHIAVGRRLGKPSVLEEYGIHVKRAEEISGPIVKGWERREVAYTNWNNVALKRGAAASMFWILSGIETPGILYPDYDHFTVYRGDATYDLLKGFARRFPTEARACSLAPSTDAPKASAFVTVSHPSRPPPQVSAHP